MRFLSVSFLLFTCRVVGGDERERNYKTLDGRRLNRLLEECEAECVRDTDCMAGLYCFQRENDEVIPGCSTLGDQHTWKSSVCVSQKPADSRSVEVEPLDASTSWSVNSRTLRVNSAQPRLVFRGIMGPNARHKRQNILCNLALSKQHIIISCQDMDNR